MGCIGSKVKSSHCYSCGSRKYPELSTIPKNYFIEDLSNPSRDIFSQAQKMSYIPSSDVNEDDILSIDSSLVKKLKNSTGSATPTEQCSNIFVAEHKVTRQQRGLSLDCEGKFRGCVVWLTGLSGAGKSTIAMGVEKQLVSRGS